MDYITQEEYLLALAEELKYLNPKDATKVLQYYQTKISNAIDYGEKEKDVIAKLPSPEQVAKETYESHSINYLEMRKRSFKRKQIFNRIIDGILSIVIIVAFFVIMYFIAASIAKMGTLIGNIFSSKEGMDMIFSGLSVLGYILIVILLSIYLIDIFLILLFHFLGNIIKLKNEELHHKIFTFTITGLIEEKTKHNKLQLKVVISVFVITVIFMVVSYLNKGYLYNSLNNVPSNEQIITLEQDIVGIDIEAINANIFFKKSETNQFYLVHQYEFEHQLNSTIISNNILEIIINKSDSYDILDLLKEPTQNLIFYVPEGMSQNIDIVIENGILDVTDISLGKITIDNEVKSTLSFVNSTIESIDVKGYNVALAVHDCDVKSVSYESTKGQFIIEKESMIKELNVVNNQAQLRFTDSTVEDINLTNTSGGISFNNIMGNTINYQSKTSENSFTDSTFTNMELDISSTCSLTLTRVVAEEIKAKCVDSFLIADYVKSTSINIEAETGSVFLTGLGQNYPVSAEQDYDYNKVTKVCNVIVKNVNANSKTEILDANVESINVIQDHGYLIFKDSHVKSGILNLVECNIVDLIDLDGGLIDLYLSRIETSITIDAEVKNSLVYNVKDWDELSYANMIKNDDTINFVVEGE